MNKPKKIFFNLFIIASKIIKYLVQKVKDFYTENTKILLRIIKADMDKC